MLNCFLWLVGTVIGAGLLGVLLSHFNLLKQNKRYARMRVAFKLDPAPSTKRTLENFPGSVQFYDNSYVQSLKLDQPFLRRPKGQKATWI